MSFLSVSFSSRISSFTRVPVEAFALPIVFVLGMANASASSSWNSQSNWANSDSDNSAPASPPPTQRSRIKNAQLQDQRTGKDIAPFAPGSNNVSLDMGQVFLMGAMGAVEGSEWPKFFDDGDALYLRSQ